MPGQVVGSAVLELLGDSAQFRGEMRRAGKAFEDLSGRMLSLGTTLTRRVTLPLVAIGAGAIAAGTKMDTLRRALTAVSGSSEQANRKLEELKEVAKLPGLAFAEAIEGQVRLQAVGVEAGRATRILKAFGNAIATTGGGRAELARVTLQIGQLSAKGKILAQDLRPIIEAAPAVGAALREAFGSVDPQDIEKLGLSTDEFLDTLATQLEKLPQVSRGPKVVFEDLGDALLRAGEAASKSLLPALTRMVEVATALLNQFSNLNPGIIAAATGFAILLAAVGPVLSALGSLTVIMSALVPLIGPVGIILAGVVAVTAAYAAWKVATTALANEQKKLTSAVDDLQVALEFVAPEARLATLKQFARAIEQDLARATESISNLEVEQVARQRLIDPASQRRLAELPGLLSAARANAQQLEGDLAQVRSQIDAMATSRPPAIVNDDVKSAVDDLRQSLQSAAILSDVLGDSFDFAGAEADAYRTAVEALADAGLSAASATGFQNKTLGELAQKYLELQGVIDDADKAQRAQAEAMRDAQQVMLQQAAAIEAIVDPLKRQNEQVALAAQLLALGVIGLERFGEVVTAAYGKAEVAVQSLSAKQELLFASLAQLGSSFAAFATSGAQSFSQFAESVIRDIARMIAQLIAFKAIAALLNVIAPGTGTAFGQFVGITARAGGGPVAAGRPYVVGERGPELFVPSSAGQVVAAGAGGGTLRLDTSSLPPYPSVVTPDAVATHDWWRRAFSHLKVDYDNRGGL